MKIAVFDTWYPDALAQWRQDYKTSPKNYPETPESIRRNMMEWTFATSDFWSRGFKSLGIEAEDYVMGHDGMWDAVVATTFASSVVVFQNLSAVPLSILTMCRTHHRKVIAHISHASPGEDRLRLCDLVITSIPRKVEEFGRFTTTKFMPLGADPVVLERFGPAPVERDIPVCFIGGVSRNHRRGNEALEQLAKAVPEFKCFGWTDGLLAKHPNLKRAWGGPSWGPEFWGTLLRSKIVVNRHAEWAEKCANNQRIFEATVCGAALVSDGEENLGDFFKIGTEALSWSNHSGLVCQVKTLLADPERTAKLAANGQARTLRDHTWRQRMEVLLEWIKAL